MRKLRNLGNLSPRRPERPEESSGEVRWQISLTQWMLAIVWISVSLAWVRCTGKLGWRAYYPGLQEIAAVGLLVYTGFRALVGKDSMPGTVTWLLVFWLVTMVNTVYGYMCAFGGATGDYPAVLGESIRRGIRASAVSGMTLPLLVLPPIAYVAVRSARGRLCRGKGIVLLSAVVATLDTVLLGWSISQFTELW